MRNMRQNFLLFHGLKQPDGTLDGVEVLAGGTLG